MTTPVSAPDVTSDAAVTAPPAPDPTTPATPPNPADVAARTQPPAEPPAPDPAEDPTAKLKKALAAERAEKNAVAKRLKAIEAAFGGAPEETVEDLRAQLAERDARLAIVEHTPDGVNPQLLLDSATLARDLNGAADPAAVIAAWVEARPWCKQAAAPAAPVGPTSGTSSQGAQAAPTFDAAAALKARGVNTVGI